VKITSRVAHLRNYLRVLIQQQSWILSKKPISTILYSLICFFTLAIITLFLLVNHSLYNLILVMVYNVNYIFSSPTINVNDTV